MQNESRAKTRLVPKALGIAALGIFMFIGLFILLAEYSPYDNTSTELPAVESLSNTQYVNRLLLGGEVLFVAVADNSSERIAGLSNREALPDDGGMLFIFDGDADHSIWMKDMRFSLDILWINSDLEVVHIESNVSPDTYPESFSAGQASRYVLEVPAGYTESKQIEIGEKVYLSF